MKTDRYVFRVMVDARTHGFPGAQAGVEVPEGEVLAIVAAKVMSRPGARALARTLERRLGLERYQVGSYLSTGDLHDNPTSYHHRRELIGATFGATYHVTSADRKFAIADLYVPTDRLAKAVTEAIADTLGFPVAMLQNLDKHPRRLADHERANPARRRSNPAPAPAIGQVWRDPIASEGLTVLEVNGILVKVRHSSNRDTEWMTADRLKELANYSAPRTNPSRSKSAQARRRAPRDPGSRGRRVRKAVTYGEKERARYYYQASKARDQKRIRTGPGRYPDAWLVPREPRTNPCHARRHNPGCPCDGRCCSARDRVCECRCRGRNHGMSSGGHRPLFSNPGVSAEKERELVVRLLEQIGLSALSRDVMDLKCEPREALEWLQSPGNRLLPESRKMIVRAALGVLTSGHGMTRGELGDIKRRAKMQSSRERLPNPSGRRSRGLCDPLGNGIAVGSVLVGIDGDNAGRYYTVLKTTANRAFVERHLDGRKFWAYPHHFRVDTRENPRRSRRRNPAEYVFSGTFRQLEPEQAPTLAPLELVKSPRVRVRAEKSPRAPHVPREPKARLQYGMYVRAPYSGPIKAFGRTITKARETGVVVGLEDRAGEPWARVYVKRGRSFTETWFPARQVRKLASKMRKPWQPLSSKHPRVWNAIKREGGGDPARIRELLDAAVAEQAEAMERAQDLVPGRRTHEGADAFRQAYGDYVKARRRVEMLELLLQELDPRTATMQPWDRSAADPWAAPAAIANPRNSAEFERAMDTFEMWHKFPAEMLTPVKVPSRRMPKHLVTLGKVKRIDYESNKWEGRPVDYTHKTKRPFPILATDPEARALYLVGGKMKPTADGLVN